MKNLQAEKLDNLEIISIGNLYKGSTWDKKYWTSSRGKDRYPYPVGYHAVRTHNGITYKMEICEGLKGPSFLIASTDGESCSGQTPDMAWESFHKKSAPRTKLGNVKRFSCKIDGMELFGFRNALVQRMLRELVSNVNGTAERNLLSTSFFNKACIVEHDAQSPKSCKPPDLFPPVVKPQSTRKRSRKDKIATIHTPNGLELEKLQPQYLSDNAEFSTTRKENQKHYKGEHCFTSSILEEDCQVNKSPSSLSAAVEVDDVIERGNKSIAIKETMDSQRFANPLEEGPGLLQGQNTVDSDDSKLISSAINLSKQEEQIEMSLFSNTQGCNSVEVTIDDTEETLSSVDSKAVKNLDLCAPDSFDLLQDCNKVSPRQVNDELDSSGLVVSEEMVRSLHIEDEVCIYTSNGSPDKSSEDSVGQDLANSMMTLLLPQALPLLKKSSGRKRAKVTSEISFINGETCLTLAAMKSLEENDGLRQNASTLSPGKLEVGMPSEGFPKEREVQLHCLSPIPHLDIQSLENAKSVVPDSFEDEQFGNHPLYQRSLCSKIVQDNEAHSGNKDTDSNRLLSSSYVQETSSTVHVHILENNEILYDKAPYNDDLKEEVLISGSHLRCGPANMHEHLKENSEHISMDSYKTSLCHEMCSTVDKVMTKDPGPSKEIPLETHNEIQPIQGASTRSSPYDQPNKQAEHRADMVVLTSNTINVEEVHTDNSTKNTKIMSKGSLDNKVVHYRRRNCSQGKRTQSSNNHRNQYNVMSERVSATSGVKHVNPIVSVSSFHMSEKEGDSIETRDGTNSNTTSFGQMSGLRPATKFRAPYSENIICRKTKDGCVAETETLSTADTGQAGALVGNLHTKVPFGAEVKLDGKCNHLTKEIGTVKSNGMLSPDQAANHHAKDEDVVNGEKHQVDAIIDGTNSSLLFQAREENLFADENVHVSKGNMVKIVTGSGQDIGNFYSDNEEPKEGLLPTQYFSLDSMVNRTPEDFVELVGCYIQPAPILSLVLSTQGDNIHISVLCGILADRLRTIFVYKVPLKEPRPGYPSFLGYTSIMLPTSKYTFSGEIEFQRFPLQFTPNGQCLVICNSFKAPYCREQSINCLCSLCTSNCSEENVVKIIHVKFGYVSLVAKLKAEDSVHSILVCEPSHLVALEKNGGMQVWAMNSMWSERVEEFTLPSLDLRSPCIVELKKNPKHPSLIIGHNGLGDFGIWDISKRVILSRFSGPRNCIFQFLPVGPFGWKRVLGRTSHNVEEQIKGIMDATERWFSGISEDLNNLSFNGENIAVWILVYSVCDSEVQYDNQANGFNVRADGCWRLALMVDNMVILGSNLDPRASVVEALEGCGIISTHDGLVYIWELSTGLKLADLHHFKSGRISCIATDPKSGVLAVAGDENQLLVYTILRPLALRNKGVNQL